MGMVKFTRSSTRVTADTRAGYRMKRAVEPGESIIQPCRPYFGGWNITFWQNDVLMTPDMTDDWEAHITPADGGELCGGCLEWVYLGATLIQGGSGDEPTVTIAVDPTDCRTLIVSVAGQDPVPDGWTLQFNASLEGDPFGWTAGFVVEPGVATAIRWGGDATWVSTDEDAIGMYPTATEPWTVTLTYESSPVGTFLWNVSTAPDPYAADLTITEGTNGFGYPELSITFNSSVNGFPEDEFLVITAMPTLDGNPLNEGTYTLQAA
jgi:hypothetical protein